MDFLRMLQSLGLKPIANRAAVVSVSGNGPESGLGGPLGALTDEQLESLLAFRAAVETQLAKHLSAPTPPALPAAPPEDDPADGAD